MADADDQSGGAKTEAGAFEISRTVLDSFQAVASSSAFLSFLPELGLFGFEMLLTSFDYCHISQKPL